MEKKKLLMFHPALAPYRIDEFNALNCLYELKIVFLSENLWNQKFNQSRLLSQLTFRYSYLLKGIGFKERIFRFGMLRTIREFKPDIILGYEFSPVTQYLIILKRLGIISQKIGSITDDSIDICSHIQSTFRSTARKIALKHLDFLVVMSQEVSAYYQKEFHLNKNQLIIAPIIQDPERLRKNSKTLEKTASEYLQRFQLAEKKILLFVGRLVQEKGLTIFLETIHPLLLENNQILVVMVGEGDELKKLQSMTEQKHLNDRIIFPGRYEGDELYAWYLCASGFVLPSTYEPFGAVVNEALIFGQKVLCSQYAGASSLIRADNGLIYNPLNKEESIEKIKLFINDIETVRDVSLSKKPSLITNHQQEFIEEWEKTGLL